MDPLAAMVEYVIPHVSATGIRVVRALVGSRGRAGPADPFAWSIGLRNRHQLHRVLTADGLPCLEDLASWIRILGWVVDAETSGTALSCGAMRAGKSSSPWFATVRRLTGRRWGEVRALGSAWMLVQFAAAVARAHP